MKRKSWCLDVLLLVLSFLGGLFLLRNAGFTLTGDDEIYRTSIETWGSWKNWAYAYYHGNSGRVLIHALLIVFTNLPPIVWKLCSAGMVAVTCYMLYRYATVKVSMSSQFVGIILACLPICTYFLLPDGVMDYSVRWASGSLNYLYPVCAMLICMFPFWKLLLGEPIGRKLKILVFLFVCLCGNMEQAAAVMAAMGVLCFAYYYWGKGKTFCKEHGKDLVFLAVVWVINTAIALIGYFAPGNNSRYTVEMISFAGYNMYTIWEKIILGFQLFILYFYSFRGLLIWLIPSCLIILMNIRKRRYLKTVPALINIVLSCIQNIIIRKVINLEFLHPFDWLYIVWIGFSVALLFYNGSMVLQCSQNKQERFWFLFIYYGLIAAGIVVCLSPTLYVSATRTMYICYILLIMIIVLMIRCIAMPSTEDPDDKHLWSKLNAIVGLVTSSVLVTLFVLGTFIVQQVDMSTVAVSSELMVEDVVIDQEKGTLKASVNIHPFSYTVDNWCSGVVDGYVINVNVGVLDTVTDTISVYRTYIHPKYAALPEYPDNKVALTGYLRDASELKQNQQFVMVFTDPWGKTWYTPLA